jgi:hypothetical protein
VKVEIGKPVFKCQEDESIFLTRLTELTGFETLLDNKISFYLFLSTTETSKTLESLQEICDLWYTSYTLLEH